MEMIRKDCRYLQWWEAGGLGINPFGIVQVGCELMAFDFSFSEWGSWRPEPTGRCFALGQLSEGLEKRLVGLIQETGRGAVWAGNSCEWWWWVCGQCIQAFSNFTGSSPVSSAPRAHSPSAWECPFMLHRPADSAPWPPRFMWGGGLSALTSVAPSVSSLQSTLCW